MMEWEKLIERLEDESSRVDCSQAQREVNCFRIKQIRLFNRPKNKTPETPYMRLDPVVERLIDGSYTVTPNKLMQE